MSPKARTKKPNAKLKAAIDHICKVDRKMARLIERVGPYTLKAKSREEIFPGLVRSIVYQQLSGKAAATIHGRVLALGPDVSNHPTPKEFLALKTQALRGAGLSQAKMLSLLDLCAKADSGRIPIRRELNRLTDDAIVELLTDIRGIGVWSAEMLLIFNLGRLDVLPATDYGVRKGFAKIYRLDELPTPKELLAFGERWRPYRTIPSWYLWRALDQDQ